MKFEPYKGEPDINRLLNAFKHRKIDRVPNFEVLIEDKHVEKILGRYAGNTLAIGGDPAKGVEESEGARPMHAKDYLELCRIIGQDAMIVEAIWTPFKLRHEDGHLSLAADRSIKSRRDFKERIVPPTDDDIEDKMQYIREYRRELDRSGTKVGLCVLLGAYFQTLYEFMIGIEDCMTLVYKDRDFIEELLETGTWYWVKFVKRALEEGVDFIWPADDVAFKTGLFLPPEIMKEMWLPHLQRIIEPAVNSGVPVMFHSDGKIDDIVPWLADIGVDCIQPMDPYGIDYRDYKKRFGSLVCLAGNIDIEFPLAHGTPEDVERDVKAHMEVLKPGGGYVATSSHSIVNYISHENFVAMVNAIHRYGSYAEGSWTFTGEEAAKAVDAGMEKTTYETKHEDRRMGVEPGALQEIFDAIYRGEQERVAGAVQNALDRGSKPADIIDGAMTPAIREVGEEFSTGELFLPDLLLAAHTMQEAMQVLTPLMEKDEGRVSRGRVIIGTIKGDLHDIGKNMVIALLKGNGFEVVDLGIDNAPADFVEAVQEQRPDVVGYSGLLTTTLGGIPDQIEALKKVGLRDKVLTIVGGAPVTREFADRNNIDLYGKDANEAVKVIEKALSG
jgi:5-methyltetrahydrofolate--homocysteine methyltransferase